MTNIKKWEQDIIENGGRFANVRTKNALYNRCAVIDESDKNITIEVASPKRDDKGNVSYTVYRETISKNDVEYVRYYTN